MLNLYNKLVNDYINGEEIDNIDELENDYKFMMKVINYSSDKNMYNLCSNMVKNNYVFVRFVIEKFKYDKFFVDSVAREYLSNVGSSDITAKELYFIMSEIFDSVSDDRAIYYRLKRQFVYENEMNAIKYLIRNEKDSVFRDSLGLGFVLVTTGDIGNSEIITNFFALKFLNDIFYGGDLSLEQLMHKEISNIEKLNLVNVKSFIIDYVRKYDVMLSDYLFVHNNLMNDIEKEIKKIIIRWDDYLNKTLERKMLIFEQEFNNIINDADIFFDYYSVCAYIDKLNLNLPIKLSFDGYTDLYPIDIRKLSLKEYDCLKKIIKLAKDLYGSSIIDPNYEYSNLEMRECNIKKRIINFK